MNKVFGIDLGTTYSCISYVDEFGKSVVLKNSEGENTTPSVVYYESLDNIIVGNEAKNMLTAEPESTIAFVKRSIGTDDENGNPVRFNFHGAEVSPEEISSKILKKLVNDANDDLRNDGVLKEDEEIKDVVITCPAYFGMREKAATKLAGELAGLNVLDIINEPTAAAINYGLLKKGNNKNVLVYDLGGGTFDVTVIQINDGEINVVYSDGDRNLGGKDWDQTVADYLAEEFERNTGTEYYVDEESANDILLITERAKKSLSSKQVVKISLNSNGKRQVLELTREKFDELTSTLLQSTIYKVDECLENAAKGAFHVTLNDIDEILLVGGSSKMPQIAKTLEEKYKKTVSLFDPDEAVSKGAAAYALIRQDYKLVISEIAKKTGKTEAEVEQTVNSGKKTLEEVAKDEKIDIASISEGNGGQLSLSSSVKITDVLSRTYGVKVFDEERGVERISNMLMKGQKLPANLIRNFVTLDATNRVSICIYESESGRNEISVDEGTQLGEAEVVFPRTMRKGTPIEVNLFMDNSGLLKLIATEFETNTIVSAEFNPAGGLSGAEISEIKSRTQKEVVN